MSDWWNNSPYTPQDQNPFEPQSEPQAPSVPSEPQIPSVPSEPQVPSVPSEPQVPSVPSEPQIPSVPSEPQIPSVPSEPQIPSVPSEPQIPSTPTTPAPVPPTYYGWSQPSPTQPPTPSSPTPSWTPQPPRPPKKKGNGIVIAVVAVLCVLCVGCLGVGVMLFADKEGFSLPPLSESEAESTTETSDVNANAPSVKVNDTDITDDGLSTADIVKNNLDSTVVINMYDYAVIKYGNFSFGSSEEETLAGTASGIVWTEDGYIITNEHVVTNEKTNELFRRIEVVLYSGATYNATVVGADEDTDLAILKINATGLKPATFGDSEKVQLGDRVVTIGNSGGLEWTVSQGILSGKNRDVYDETGYSIQCLQIDAAINPGNSGGPLLNRYGEVIGVNSAKIVYTSIENVGFSIPISQARTIIEDLVKYGHVTGRVGLGVTGYTITQTGYEGFMIYTIEPGSSLEGTEIKQYDIITKVGNTVVKSRTEVRNALSKYKPNQEVTLTLKRIVDQRTGEVTEFTCKIKLKEVTT